MHACAARATRQISTLTNPDFCADEVRGQLSLQAWLGSYASVSTSFSPTLIKHKRREEPPKAPSRPPLAREGNQPWLTTGTSPMPRQVRKILRLATVNSRECWLAGCHSLGHYVREALAVAYLYKQRRQMERMLVRAAVKEFNLSYHSKET